MSDEDYSEEEYEYEYSDAESDAGTDDVSMDARSQEGEEDSDDDDDESMTDSNNNNNSKKKAASDNGSSNGTNKRRSTGTFDSRRRSGDNPNAAPMGGGKFDFDGEFFSIQVLQRGWPVNIIPSLHCLNIICFSIPSYLIVTIIHFFSNDQTDLEFACSPQTN